MLYEVITLFTEQVPADARQEGHQARVLECAAADRIGDRHVAEAGRLQQTRDPQPRILAQLQGVAIGIVEAPQDDVDLVQPLDRFEPDPPVADAQVITLDQRIAEIIGQIGMFEVGRAVRP